MAADYDGWVEIRWRSEVPKERFCRASRLMVSDLRTAATAKKFNLRLPESAQTGQSQDTMAARRDFSGGNQKTGGREDCRGGQRPMLPGSACPHPGQETVSAAARTVMLLSPIVLGRACGLEAIMVFAQTCASVWRNALFDAARGCLPVAQPLSSGSSCGCLDFQEAPRSELPGGDASRAAPPIGDDARPFSLNAIVAAV
jgi:hypothetical protein